MFRFHVLFSGLWKLFALIVETVGTAAFTQVSILLVTGLTGLWSCCKIF